MRETPIFHRKEKFHKEEEEEPIHPRECSHPPQGMTGSQGGKGGFLQERKPWETKGKKNTRAQFSQPAGRGGRPYRRKKGERGEVSLAKGESHPRKRRKLEKGPFEGATAAFPTGKRGQGEEGKERRRNTMRWGIFALC